MAKAGYMDLLPSTGATAAHNKADRKKWMDT